MESPIRKLRQGYECCWRNPPQLRSKRSECKRVPKDNGATIPKKFRYWLIPTVKACTVSLITRFSFVLWEFGKAFDSIKLGKVWQMFSKMDVPKYLINLLKSPYADVTAAVRIEEVDSESFRKESSVRQEYRFSPVLFNIYTGYIMLFLLQVRADVLSHRLEISSVRSGFAINRWKTKIMLIDRAGHTTTNPSYIANCEGGYKEEIRWRSAITWSVVGGLDKIWKDRRITKSTEVRLIMRYRLRNIKKR